MLLLELPQELLDLIGPYLDAFAYLALRQTGKLVYEALGDDDGLRTALVELEMYWITEANVFAVMRKVPHPQPEPYASYRDFLGRAACYTCLNITTPSMTHQHSHH